MWKLALITVLATVLGEGSTRNLAGPPGQNRVVRSANDLDTEAGTCPTDCSTHQDTVHMIVHRPMGTKKPLPPVCCGDTRVHVHVDGSQRDIFHGNAVPGSEHWARGKMAFAKCEIVPGSRTQLSGNIYMAQDLMGAGPVHTFFDISGFDESAGHTAHHGHEHAFQVTWNGDTGNTCGETGNQFNLPPPKRHGHGPKTAGGGRARRHHDNHDEHHHHEGHEDHEGHGHSHHDHDLVKRHAHGNGPAGQGPAGQGRPGKHAGHGKFGFTNGALGNLECDSQGKMNLDKFYFDFSLLGLHSVYGRSITIRTAGEPDSAPLACCTIAHDSGADHWGYDDSLNKWLKTEMEPGAEGAVEDNESHHGHGHHKHGGK